MYNITVKLLGYMHIVIPYSAERDPVFQTFKISRWNDTGTIETEVEGRLWSATYVNSNGHITIFHDDYWIRVLSPHQLTFTATPQYGNHHESHLDANTRIYLETTVFAPASQLRNLVGGDNDVIKVIKTFSKEVI